MTLRDLDIIVPIYKNAELVRACVDSLIAHLPEIADLRPRVVLVNDSPDDAQVQDLLAGYADRAGPQFVVLTNAHNLGFVRTVNNALAVSQRDGHDVLLVNSDTVTFAGTLANIMRTAAADPQIAFVSPRSNNASICSLPHFHNGVPPTPADAHARWSQLSRTMPDWHFAPTAVGFYMWIAHSVLANHGGLQEEFGVGYEEENDLIMRAGKLGQRAVLANNAFAYHAGSASFSLTALNLQEHRYDNHLKVIALHPEFLPLVARYENSPHFRAERLMSGLLKDDAGRLRLVIDLTGLGMHHNGTNELALAVVRSLAARWGDRLRLGAICTAESFRFHGLDDLQGLVREEPAAPGVHAIAIRFGQPYDMHHVNVLESLAPINVFAMLDTISEDCGPLAAGSNFLELWDHVATHANGLLFISKAAERAFCVRHPQAQALPRMARLLSTRLADYRKPPSTAGGQHVLVLGNHFPHKASDPTAARLAALHPTLKFVVLGASTFERANLTGFRSGTLENAKVDALFANASAIVLPSHMEGFGFGLMHALAAGHPVVARRLEATEEILATLDDVQGVHLFDDDSTLNATLLAALASGRSHADDRHAGSWDDWADEVATLSLGLAARDDIFPRLTGRIAAADRLRRALRGDAANGASPNELMKVPRDGGVPEPSAASAKALDLASLMALEGRSFVEHAYSTLLQRPADDSGLGFYVAELESGVDKVTVLHALATSTEGRARAVSLPGLEALFDRRKSRSRSLWQRLLRA